MKMRSNKRLILSILFLLLIFLTACGAFGLGEESPTEESVAESLPTPTEELIPPTLLPTLQPGQAVIESLEILSTETTPPGYNARVRGVLSDGCTAIDSINSQQENDLFTIDVTTSQLANSNCEDEGQNFDEIVSLDTSGLTAGTYTVAAGEMRGSFMLQPASATDEPEPEATVGPGDTSISGTIWFDFCAPEQSTGEDGPPGCVLTEDDTFVADSQFDDEEVIAGVQVGIGEGECPAIAFTAVETDSSGNYIFSAIEAGTYCVFVPMNVESNQEILSEGTWTAPQDGVPQTTVAVSAGEAVADINFGWYDQPAPPAEVDLTNCENSFEFLEDISVPDDTIVPPGGEFTKTWLLGNNGTCPWTVDYSVNFVGGDLMSADEPLPLTEQIPPGGELRLSIDMVAPEEEGTYRGNYQIANPEGELFGIDGNIEDAFWLRIIVEEGAEAAATPLPNSAAIGGVVWEDLCVNSDPGGNCIEFPEGSGSFIANGTLNGGEPRLSGIRIVLAEGTCPDDGTFPPEDTILEETLTGDDGAYLFEDLADGTYCIFMDALAEATLDLLIPGNWTWPGTGVGGYSFILDPGEQALDLDFGWDYLE